MILVVVDTLRADRLTAYGHDRPTSPAIDRMAKEGVLYEEAVSASSWTLPGHASLFTGLFPHEHGTTSQHQTLEPAFDTLAERLARAGYRTGGFSNNVWTNDTSGLKQGFGHFEELWREQDTRKKGISHDDPTVDMGAARTTDRVLGWIDEGEGPFFAFINYFEPHLPYRPPRPFHRKFLPADVDQGTVQRLRSFYSPREYGYILSVPWMKTSERDIEVLSALYDAEIAYVDSHIARLRQGLEARGLGRDTLVVITSDHGEHLGENHMLSHKLSIYEPLLRVPLILWYPSVLDGGTRLSQPVQAHDVFGTILGLTDVDADAEPKLPLTTADQGRRLSFAELAYPQIFLDVIQKKIPGWDSSDFARALAAVRDGRHKLIWGSDDRLELYDLEADPLESRNLAETQPVIAARLLAELKKFYGGQLPEHPDEIGSEGLGADLLAP